MKSLTKGFFLWKHCFVWLVVKFLPFGEGRLIDWAYLVKMNVQHIGYTNQVIYQYIIFLSTISLKCYDSFLIAVPSAGLVKHYGHKTIHTASQTLCRHIVKCVWQLITNIVFGSTPVILTKCGCFAIFFKWDYRRKKNVKKVVFLNSNKLNPRF